MKKLFRLRLRAGGMAVGTVLLQLQLSKGSQVEAMLKVTYKELIIFAAPAGKAVAN